MWMPRSRTEPLASIRSMSRSVAVAPAGTTNLERLCPVLRVGQPVGDQAGDGLLGRAEAGPAELRPAARPAAAAAEAGLARCAIAAPNRGAGHPPGRA
jgi:hypothetical protein